MTPAGAARGTTRDALTHFDECGIVVLSSQPELLDLLRDFRWKALFVERRADVRAPCASSSSATRPTSSCSAPFAD
jgi:hypothetical protein